MSEALLNTTLVARENRTRFVGLRMTAEEGRVVEAVAKEEGIGLSEVVRLAIRKTYASWFKRAKKRKP